MISLVHHFRAFLITSCVATWATNPTNAALLGRGRICSRIMNTTRTDWVLSAQQSTIPILCWWKSLRYSNVSSSNPIQSPPFVGAILIVSRSIPGFGWLNLVKSPSGWWFEPSWKILVNGKDYPIYEMENNPNVWNHQPAIFCLVKSCQNSPFCHRFPLTQPWAPEPPAVARPRSRPRRHCSAALRWVAWGHRDRNGPMVNKLAHFIYIYIIYIYIYYIYIIYYIYNIL